MAAAEAALGRRTRPTAVDADPLGATRTPLYAAPRERSSGRADRELEAASRAGCEVALVESGVWGMPLGRGGLIHGSGFHQLGVQMLVLPAVEPTS